MEMIKIFGNDAGWFVHVPFGSLSLVWDAERCVLYVGAFGRYCII